MDLLVELVGQLRYRTSFGQNCLDHSLEVAWLSGVLAGEIGLDAQRAKRAGLLHDVGKAVDMLDHFKANSIKVAEAEELDREVLEGKIVVGEFEDEEKEELASQWAALKREVMEDTL